MRNNWMAYGILGVVLVLAVWMRFYGLGWGTDPESGVFYRFHPDEETVVEGARWVGEDLKQAKTSYGKAPLYLLWASARIAGGVWGVDVLDREDNRAVRLLFLIARGISALLGALTVGVVFGIGRRLGGVWTGVLGAGLLAFCAGHIQQSHYGTVDVAFAFWTTLGLALMLRMPSDRLWVYGVCGVVCGLATGTRLAGIWLGVPFALVHLWSGRRWRALVGAPAVLYVTVAGLVSLACEPYLVLDPDYFWGMDDVRKLVPSMQVARGELVRLWTLYDFSTTPYLFYVTHLFRFALGVPLEAAALCGAALACWFRGRAAWAILGWLLPYFALVGALHTQPVRYTTPMLPGLCVLGAWACTLGAGRLRRAAALPVLLVGLPTLVYGMSMLRVYGAEDSRFGAARWVRAHIPEGACVFTERGGFPTDWMTPEERYRVRDDEANFFLQTEGYYPYATQVAFVEQKLNGVSWIVLIEENRMRQFLEVPVRYPVGHGFYRRLRAGELGFEEVAAFKVQPGVGSWTFSEADAEPSMTAYDHPRVLVYRRTAADGAMAAWTREVMEDPGLPDRYVREGAAAYMKGQWEAAAGVFGRALEVRPGFKLGAFLLMHTYIRMGREPEARAIWDREVGTQGLVPVELGVGLIEAGLKAEGAGYLEQMLAFNAAGRNHLWVQKAAAYARWLLGRDYAEAGRYEEAQAEYERAIRVKPEFVPPYSSLGALYVSQERYEEAVPVLKRAVELDGSVAGTWALLVRAQRKAGDEEGANQTLSRARRRHPSYRFAWEENGPLSAVLP